MTGNKGRPLDKWSNLVNARSNILMNQSSVLTLNNNPTTGLHPAMTGMRDMYNNGKLMIVQGVSYPNPSYSHFLATDIWFTASGGTETLDTGWLGRTLDQMYPGYPVGYPTTDMPDPLAIQIGSMLPFSLQGPNMNMGYSTTDPNSLLNVINGITDPAPNNDYGKELTFLRLMKDQSNVYRTVIQNAYNVAQSPTATYPSNNLLADQLKIVARLIHGGLQTPIYVVNHPNTHDTHDNQVLTTDKTQGAQATNLSILSAAVAAFEQDLELMGRSTDVTGMTFSEFGRKIKSNSSIGTDHGAAAPVFFFGGALNTNPSTVAGTNYPVPGMIGSSPAIPVSATVNDQVPMQFDYRQIYSTIMQDWLCMSSADAAAILGASYTKLPIFQNYSVVPIQLLSFTGRAENSVSHLKWSTASELNTASFEIERSTDSIHFYKLGTKAAAGNSSTVVSYDYIDAAPLSGTNYYRLKQIDIDGVSSYSQVVLIFFGKEQRILLFPNPASDIIHLSLLNNKADVPVEIFDNYGRKVYETMLPRSVQQKDINIQTFAKGHYYIRMTTDQGLVTQTFIKL